MRPIATDGVAWSVCQSVYRSVDLSDTIVSRAKAAEPIEMPFGTWTRVGPMNHALHGVTHLVTHLVWPHR